MENNGEKLFQKEEKKNRERKEERKNKDVRGKVQDIQHSYIQEKTEKTEEKKSLKK